MIETVKAASMPNITYEMIKRYLNSMFSDAPALSVRSILEVLGRDLGLVGKKAHEIKTRYLRELIEEGHMDDRTIIPHKPIRITYMG
jgi:hypothetical protein